MPGELFEQAAPGYEAWYATRRGQRVDRAERALLEWLLTHWPEARDVLEVGCGTGHFAGWLASKSLKVFGLDRSRAMLAEIRKCHPEIPIVCGDGHRLPFRRMAVDLTAFLTTLEFLEDPAEALAEAVGVSRLGLMLVILNRWSAGGLSRRWGPQARRPLLGLARDATLADLREMVRNAAGARLRDIRWRSALFPGGLWASQARIPLGDVIGIAAVLTPAEVS
jgi:SAM-dependent methyltransferase